MRLEALKEFRHFPGSILMTSNCLMPPMGTFAQTEKSRSGQKAAFKPNEAFEGLRFRSRAVHRASQSQMEENRVESSHEASIGSCWDPLGAKPQPTTAQTLKPKSQHPTALSPEFPKNPEPQRPECSSPYPEPKHQASTEIEFGQRDPWASMLCQTWSAKTLQQLGQFAVGSLRLNRFKTPSPKKTTTNLLGS